MGKIKGKFFSRQINKLRKKLKLNKMVRGIKKFAKKHEDVLAQAAVLAVLSASAYGGVKASGRLMNKMDDIDLSKKVIREDPIKFEDLIVEDSRRPDDIDSDYETRKKVPLAPSLRVAIDSARGKSNTERKSDKPDGKTPDEMLIESQNSILVKQKLQDFLSIKQSDPHAFAGISAQDYLQSFHLERELGKLAPAYSRRVLKR
jgi:hypothetical protein